MVEILLFFASAVFVDFVGYWLHRLAHVPGSPLHRAHLTHHAVNYPPQSVLSDRYRSSRKDSLIIWFAPVGIAYAGLVALAAPHPIPVLVGGLVSAALSSALHDLSHISGSIVWRWSLLKGIGVRHHAHHFKMKRNFGILLPVWDNLFGTRLRKSHRLERDPVLRHVRSRHLRRSQP